MMTEQNYKPVIRIERDSLADGINKGFYYNHEIDKILPKVTFLCARDVPSLVDRGMLPSTATINQTFLQCPFGETQYVALDEYELFSMRRKLFHIEHIATLLGAKMCKYEFSIASSGKRQLKGDVHVQTGNSCDVSAKLQQDEERRFSQYMSMSNTYSGAMPTITTYQEANDYAKTHNLVSDTDVQRLLLSRDPSRQNLIETMQLKVLLSKELNRNVDFAADLCAINNLINIDTNFLEHVEIKNECVMDLSFVFAMS